MYDERLSKIINLDQSPFHFQSEGIRLIKIDVELHNRNIHKNKLKLNPFIIIIIFNSFSHFSNWEISFWLIAKFARLHWLTVILRWCNLNKRRDPGNVENVFLLLYFCQSKIKVETHLGWSLLSCCCWLLYDHPSHAALKIDLNYHKM